MNTSCVTLADKNLLIARLFEYRKIVDNHWFWIGSTSNKGYGLTHVENKHYSVHRISAYLFLGLNLDDPNNQALHKAELCNYRNCFNPEHLYVGTHQDNMEDRANFGGYKHNERTHCSQGHKLTADNVYYESGRRELYKRCRKCRLEQKRKYRERDKVNA